jgi:hypothetical protein
VGAKDTTWAQGWGWDWGGYTESMQAATLNPFETRAKHEQKTRKMCFHNLGPRRNAGETRGELG